MEVFRSTDPDATPKKQYTKEDSRFIRSKLPLRHAFKIGVSGLKSKPIRLFFTVLLRSVAFVLFGLLSTLNFYNSEATFRQTLRDSDISAVTLNKQYELTSIWYSYGEEKHAYETWNECRFTPAEVDKLVLTMNADAFGALDYGGSFNLRQSGGAYWMNSVRSFAYLPSSNSLRSGLQGEYPQQTGELAISSYFADMLVACNGYDSTGTAMELDDRYQLLGKSISMGGKVYKIIGIIDSGTISSEFDSLKDGTQNDYTLQNKLRDLLNSGLHTLVFVSEEQVEKLAQEYRPYKEGRENYMRIATGIYLKEEYQISEYANARYNGISALSANQKLYALSKEGTALADDEILLPTNQFLYYFADTFSMIREDIYNQSVYDEDYEKYEALWKYYDNLISTAWQLAEGGFWEHPEVTDAKDENAEPVFHAFSDEEYDKLLAELLQATKKENMDMTIGVRLFDDWNQAYLSDVQVFKVVGLYKQTDYRYELSYYLSDTQADAFWAQQKSAIPDYYDAVTDYVEDPNAIYSSIYLPGNVPEEKIDAYWEVYGNTEFGEDSSRIVMRGGVVSSLQMVDSFVESTSQIFLYAGLVLAVFAALLLSNFISVSISNKKRDIGILRAVGARSLDVFKIFFSESFVIGLICTAISCGASLWLCNMFNQEYGQMLGASVFVFGIPSIAVLIGIAAVTIIVATFIPVQTAAKKKPVDSIKG